MKFYKSVWAVVVLCAALLWGPQASAQFVRGTRSESVVNIAGTAFYVHTVAKGETLYSLWRLYEVSESDIVKNNPQAIDGLRVGQVLKIPVAQPGRVLNERQIARRFEQHTVMPGETAYSISKTYAISVSTLIEDNKDLDPTHLSVGQRLNIRRSDVGSQSTSRIGEQWERYTEALNSVTPGDVYHLVRQGETIYGLSRKYNVAQDEILKANDMGPQALQTGMIIKIPVIKEASGVVAKPGAETASDVSARPGTPALGDLFSRANIEPRRFEGGVMNVAMLLPLSGGGENDRNYLEFYQGTLLALDDLRRQGVAVQLNLFDTERSAQKTAGIVDSAPFQKSDLVIGPVYEETLDEVLKFALHNRVAVVSPLAQIGNTECPLLYQLSPAPAPKYDKLRRMLSPEKNITVITGATVDTEFEAEIAPLLPANYKRLTYSKTVSASSLEDLIRGERESVLVVLIEDEYTIDNMMARISSVRTNLLARGIPVGQVCIVGSSRWQRFKNVDRNLFFKLNLCFVSSYHADRSNPVVLEFNKRYVAAFGALPSLYSYRGYDAMKLFVGTTALRGPGLSFESALNLSSLQMLQMRYHFEQKNRGGNHVNTEWALVCYRSDYTIEVR